MSHPTRVRGLKLGDVPTWVLTFVAPHTGAWIETCCLTMLIALTVVAPHTGAWIETALIGCCHVLA